jgi:ABC-type Fe3+ transport system substrate-binding protein
MRTPRKSRRGTSAVLGVMLLVLVSFAFGIVYFGFVNTNISLATANFNTQMVALLLKSFSINATHIVAYLQNEGSKIVEITNAYVNGLITNLATIVQIVPNAIEAAVLQGSFVAGNTYSVKLANIFNMEVTFQASF